MLLAGIVNWDDVKVDKAIPVPSVKGQRDQGKVKDLVTAHFGGFRLEMFSPFESDQHPMGCVKVSRGSEEVQGPLDASTWINIANFIIEKKKQGVLDGGTDSSSSIASGTDWGR